MWHHAVSQCRGIEDVETGKKHCVDPTARYPSKFHFDHLTMWDGKGCGRYSSCCEGEGKPWFFKDLSQSVNMQ